MINGTYEEGVKDCLKFLQDNSKVELINMDTESFITLLSQLSERGTK